MQQEYMINTLHRGKYMLCFFILLFIAGGLSSLIPAKEIIKIVVILCTIPLTLYCSVKISQNPSKWTVSEEALSILFNKKSINIPLSDISYIQRLTRSGGNLYVIHFHKKSPQRYWRNKLFQKDDDQDLLHDALTEHPQIEYYKF